MFLETVSLPQETQVGCAEPRVETGTVTGHGIFRAVLPSRPNLAAVIPLERGVCDEAVLVSSNTESFVTPAAMANR